ncbi:hypothetical protein [Labrys miyagiensis]|uniref:hypothetical protein n=1 Tax=Labrys miyagiensis TaxID=346912 RepID=UPI0024E11679|nr:hypothetical protein [Labrys miyagiensis]
MSAGTFYAIVPFVRDTLDELIALEPSPANTRYSALREASYSVGRIVGDAPIVGAVVFAREMDDSGTFDDIVVVARYGETFESRSLR